MSMLASMLYAGYSLVAVCTWNLETTSGPDMVCYDTMFESTTVIICDDYEWDHQPYPWEWTNGTIILGYYDSFDGKFVENYRFQYIWGGWDVLPFENYRYIVGIDNRADGMIFNSSMEGHCYEQNTRD